MAVYGYARISNEEAIINRFKDMFNKKYGIDNENIVFDYKQDTLSRPALDSLIEKANKGDYIYVRSMKDLASTLDDLLDVITTFWQAEVDVNILDVNLDTSNSIGRLMMHLCMVFSNFNNEFYNGNE